MIARRRITRGRSGARNRPRYSRRGPSDATKKSPRMLIRQSVFSSSSFMTKVPVVFQPNNVALALLRFSFTAPIKTLRRTWTKFTTLEHAHSAKRVEVLDLRPSPIKKITTPSFKRTQAQMEVGRQKKAALNKSSSRNQMLKIRAKRAQLPCFGTACPSLTPTRTTRSGCMTKRGIHMVSSGKPKRTIRSGHEHAWWKSQRPPKRHIPRTNSSKRSGEQSR